MDVVTRLGAQAQVRRRQPGKVGGDRVEAAPAGVRDIGARVDIGHYHMYRRIGVEPLCAVVPAQVLAQLMVEVEVGAVPGGIGFVGKARERTVLLLAVRGLNSNSIGRIELVRYGQVGLVALGCVVFIASGHGRATGAVGEAVARAVAVDVLPVHPGAEVGRPPADVGDDMRVVVLALQVVPSLNDADLKTEHTIARCRRPLEGVQGTGMLGWPMHEGIGVAVEVCGAGDGSGKPISFSSGV